MRQISGNDDMVRYQHYISASTHIIVLRKSGMHVTESVNIFVKKSAYIFVNKCAYNR